MNKNGIKWGPFTLRIPFIHTKLLTAEFLQGLVISGATALAAAPIAIALGYNENRKDAEEDEKESNPIAKQLNKREEEDAILDFSLLNDDDPMFEEPASPGRRTAVIFAIMVMILAIALALFLAHLSGRAFWLQG